MSNHDARIKSLFSKGKEKHYQLVSKAQERTPRFSIVFADGRIQQEQYTDLHSCQFSPAGDSLVLHISYSPALICTGHNLLKLEQELRYCKLPAFEVYREGYHDNTPDEDDPVIESIAVLLPDKEKTT